MCRIFERIFLIDLKFLYPIFLLSFFSSLLVNSTPEALVPNMDHYNFLPNSYQLPEISATATYQNLGNYQPQILTNLDANSQFLNTQANVTQVAPVQGQAQTQAQMAPIAPVATAASTKPAAISDPSNIIPNSCSTGLLNLSTTDSGQSSSHSPNYEINSVVQTNQILGAQQIQQISPHVQTVANMGQTFPLQQVDAVTGQVGQLGQLPLGLQPDMTAYQNFALTGLPNPSDPNNFSQNFLSGIPPIPGSIMPNTYPLPLENLPKKKLTKKQLREQAKKEKLAEKKRIKEERQANPTMPEFNWMRIRRAPPKGHGPVAGQGGKYRSKSCILENF